MVKSRLNPKIRITLFLVAINAAWMVGAWWGLDRESWLWITPIALSINFLMLTYDRVLTFSKLKSEPLLGQDPWGVLKLVNQISSEFQRPAPQVFLITHPGAQVFTYGKSGKSARLFVTEGALKLLNERELRAVLVFQILAIKNSFSVLNYWLGAVIDLLYRIGKVLERAVALLFGWTPPLAAWLITPWIWLLHHLLMSPNDFKNLDEATASKIEAREDLAQALWKMEAYAQTQPWMDPWVFAHMCMVSPLGTGIFRVQPSLKGRIKHLIGRYPL